MTIMQKFITIIFNNYIGRIILGVPKGKKIYKITKSSAHYYTGDISNKNGLPIICTGTLTPGGHRIINKLSKITNIFILFIVPFILEPLKYIGVLFVGSTTGYKNPSANGAYANQYINPTNAYAENGSFATASDSGGGGSGRSHSFETFGFGLTGNETIDGVLLKAKHKYSGDASDGGYIIWYCASESAWSSNGVITFSTTNHWDEDGGVSDLWGKTPIPDDFSDINFSFIFSESRSGGGNTTWYIDNVQAQVYYTIVAVYVRNFRLRSSNYEVSTVVTD